MQLEQTSFVKISSEDKTRHLFKTVETTITISIVAFMAILVEYVKKIICRVGEFTRNAKGLLQLISLNFVWVGCQGNFLICETRIEYLKS